MPLVTVSTADIPVFHLQGLYTLPTSRDRLSAAQYRDLQPGSRYKAFTKSSTVRNRPLRFHRQGKSNPSPQKPPLVPDGSTRLPPAIPSI